jgi:uncharacterized iron-regulated protein
VIRSPVPRRIPPTLPAALPAVLLAALLGACSAAAPPPERASSYAYPVPPGVTFDMARGAALTPQQADARLARVRVLFLGEHHSEPASHAYQREVLARLADGRRPLVVALEMFPPEVDPVLEDWRQGRLDELTFLERADWYGHWGFAWEHYRALFELLRDRRVPLRGVNATRAEREAVREGRVADLLPDVRELLGDPDEEVPPHAAYLLDALREAGHGGALRRDSETFRHFYRVQRLWDRVMGVRTERLAAALPADGLAVLLVGSGHLAFGLGANLQAARAGDLPRLSVWDAVVEPEELDARGRYPVPIGMADWVRVVVRAGAPPEPPSLGALRLEAAPRGVRVAAVHALGRSALKALQAGDVILALNGAAPRSPTALRLAYERLPAGATARVRVLRGGAELELDVTPPPHP